MDIESRQNVLVHQVFEPWELLGYETRNKYEVLSEAGEQIGYAAEQQRGMLGFFLRQNLGHWRKFDIHFYNKDRSEYMLAHHPFRFIFQELNITGPDGEKLGSLKQRFSLLYKKFDILNESQQVVMQMRSPLWKPWTFPFYVHGRVVAQVLKKFSGVFTEIFTDKDKFIIEYKNHHLTENERKVILATSVFIDIIYFEAKAKR